MQYVRKGVVCNRITAYETQNVESICSELIISKKRWMIFAVYRPPDSANLASFFNELSNSVNFALERYDNIVVLGDFNIDTQNEQYPGYNKFNLFQMLWACKIW